MSDHRNSRLMPSDLKMRIPDMVLEAPACVCNLTWAHSRCQLNPHPSTLNPHPLNPQPPPLTIHVVTYVGLLAPVCCEHRAVQSATTV